MRTRALLIVLLLFLGVLSVLYVNKATVEGISRENAARRQVLRVCEGLARGDFDRNALCSQRLTEIPSLERYYANIQEQDGQWYSEHGWNYFPRVKCDSAELIFEIAGFEISCEEVFP